MYTFQLSHHENALEYVVYKTPVFLLKQQFGVHIKHGSRELILAHTSHVLFFRLFKILHPFTLAMDSISTTSPWQARNCTSTVWYHTICSFQNRQMRVKLQSICWSILLITLTHWGRVTHICVRELTIIGLDNGLSPGRRHSIILTNAGILWSRTSGTNFMGILIEIHTFWFQKMHLKMSSGNWRPFCLGLNALTISCNFIHAYSQQKSTCQSGWHRLRMEI